VPRVESKATNRVDGRLHQDQSWEGADGTAKKPRSFCEPGASPRQGRGVVPRSFGTDGFAFLFQGARKTHWRGDRRRECRIGMRDSDEGCGKPALPNQILADAPELAGSGGRQSEQSLRGGGGWGWGRKGPGKDSASHRTAWQAQLMQCITKSMAPPQLLETPAIHVS